MNQNRKPECRLLNHSKFTIRKYPYQQTCQGSMPRHISALPDDPLPTHSPDALVPL